MKRSDKITGDLFIDALSKRVIMDAKIKIIYDHNKNKLRAYCEQVDSFLNFPNDLRKEGKEYITDIVEVPATATKSTYYRAKHGTIRPLLTKQVEGRVVG